MIAMDASKYANMLTDLTMGTTPDWAKLDFLDRDKGSENESGPKKMQSDIKCL
jgi:hypothetical protein